MPPKTRKQEKKDESDQPTALPTTESIMATLSMQTRTTTSLAPADHSTAKSHKASNINSLPPAIAHDPSLLDKVYSVNTDIEKNSAEILNAQASHDSTLSNPSKSPDGAHTAGAGQHSPVSTFGSTYAEFIAFANSNLPPPITDPESATNATISEAINKLYALMQSNLHQSSSNMVELTGHFQTLEGKIDNVRERQNEFEERIIHQLNETKVQVNKHEERLTSLESDTVKRSEYDALKTQLHQLKDELNERFQSAAEDMLNLRLENFRTANNTSKLEERVNVHDLRAKKFSFLIEGFPETQNEKLNESLLTRLNTDAGTDLVPQNFKSIRRVGKVDTKKNQNNMTPRPIALVVYDEETRSKLLSCRGKLSKNANDTFLWINEELPPAYRRRKSMLRDLVKLAVRKGRVAKIESGGINLDGVLYTPETFPQLPNDLQPHHTRVLTNSKGNIIFSGEYAYLSNMYPCKFLHNKILFTSGEQCCQFEKAQFHNDHQSAHRILTSNDPFTCKSIGDEVERSPEWNKIQIDRFTTIQRAKFNQHPKLREALVATGEAKLIEATTGNYWGINGTIHSKSALDEIGKGQNQFGKILMQVRKDFTPPPHPPSTQSQP